MAIGDFSLGQSAELTRTFTEEDVMAFAHVTGDFNPVHVDAAAAAASPFGARIVHGMLTASLFSTLLATKLPGPGAIYLSQSLAFLRPVKLGDTVTAQVAVTAIDVDKRRLTLETLVRNERGKTWWSVKRWCSCRPEGVTGAARSGAGTQPNITPS